MPSSLLDIIILIILVAFILFGMAKGLIRTIFNFFSFILSFAIANWLHPHMTNFLRTTGALYDSLKQYVAEALNLQGIWQETGKAAESALIEALPLPGFIKGPMITGNNPEVYKLLDVSGLEDYIAGFVANIILSGIAFILVFLIALITVKVLGHTLDLIARLPVIHSFNKLGGALAGLGVGVVIIWILTAASVLFIARPSLTWLYDALPGSVIAKFFYDSNPLLNIVLKLFP